MFKFYIVLLSSFSVFGFSQSRLDDIDLLKVPQKKIRHFIKNQENHNIHKFRDVKATYYAGQDTAQYQRVEKKYFIEENLSKVWNCYKTTSPSESWKGKMISFGLLFDKSNNKIMYANDSFAGVDTGQVVYVNLKIMRGLYNLAVAFEIKAIDEINKAIIFSYVEGGKTRGEQLLQFIDTKNGFTEIIHSTLFKSNSRFRDKHLYPLFHLKAINEFHQNILRKILITPASSKKSNSLITLNTLN